MTEFIRDTIAEVAREELLAFYEGKTAKWQIPDDVVFVEAIPLGATGKMSEKKQKGIRGSGTEVKQALASLPIDTSSPAAFLAGLDTLYTNFEVKVPGQLIASEWKPIG